MENRLSRRTFLGLVGGATSVAALSAIGTHIEGKSKKPTANIDNMKYEEVQSDVLVIGGGMAGLFAAVKAHDNGANVLMVSKGRLGSSGQTPFAKGIFSYDANKEKLSIDEFVAKVSRSALGTNNAVYTKQMAENSKKRVEELKEWGFFDAPLCYNSFLKPMSERNIPVLERIIITHLLKENEKIAGAVGFSIDEEKIITFKSKSVILCTGAGGFKPNGFPICDLTHDGTIMAYEIGAKVTGKEWNDGHVGQMKNAADSFGGWHGMFERTPGTTGVEVHHDLGVDLNYIAYKSGSPVSMGPPHLMAQNRVVGGPYTPQEFQRQGNPGGPPGGNNEKGARGGPPGDGERKGAMGGEDGPPGMKGESVGGASAGLAIHKSEGITPINDRCESSIKGLYAAGDALGSYMAGAIYTQIGSSLAGSAVQGAVAGEYAAKYSAQVSLEDVSQEKLKSIYEQILAPLKREKGYSPAWVTQTLQGIMIPNFVLYIKKESMLKGALAYIDELYEHHVPMLKASSLHELRLAHETKNMIIAAKMKLEASILRKESRCSHYRLDYPETDTQNWNAWINIYKDNDGKMAFEKQPFGTWPMV
jgi:succinate dehydrogenase/fumarate reductase flavoprotein subunit